MSLTSKGCNPVRVVISQSMYFPWVGMLEQVRLADIFVHYDDVQMTKGFYNRVQLKTANGSKWITVPIRDHHRGQRIDEAMIDDRQDWRSHHRSAMRHAYLEAPYLSDALSLVDSVFSLPVTTLAELTRASLMSVVDYFGLKAGRRFLNSASLNIGGSKSQRLLDIVVAVGGKSYVSGHGALNYLDHDLFDRHEISVDYMQYQCIPYPQLHGTFTPYVTALDLVANCGRRGAEQILSGTRPWKEVTQ